MNPSRIRAAAALALVAAVTLVALLASDPGAPPAAEAAAGRPPVVLVVFDEFPTASLLDRSGHIDPVRYPNFAALAGESNWFPYATAAVDETGRAMEAMLSGNMPERKRPVTAAKNPHNLFTFLGGRGYRIDASEEVSSLCPRRLCPHVRPQNQDTILRGLASGRPERLQRWVRSIRPSRRPTLFFKHILLPHVPLRYLPSGRHYSDRPHPLQVGLLHAFNSRWPVTEAYQRHLLQVGYTDRALGSVLNRLRAQGIYDSATIVVTADNGESFGRFGNRHEISRRNAADIALTPLLVKEPRQSRGRVVSRHVRTLDVVPTIARLSRLRVPWRTRGRSMLGPAARRIPRGESMLQRSGRRIPLSYAVLRRRGRAALRHKIALFGSGDGGPGLYGIGPEPRLLGTPLFMWPVTKATGLRAELNDRPAQRSVRLRSSFSSSQVTGRLVGPRASGPQTLAIAVNGLISATGTSFSAPGLRGHYFAMMVPEFVFIEGANRVQVFAVSHRGGGLRLEALD